MENQREEVGTVIQLTQYLNQHREIFQKQKGGKEYMERVMAMLSQENMQILQKQFRLYPKGLQLPTFIYLMNKLYVAQSQISKYFFVSDCIKFFQSIDINGDGHLEWSQFTEYIIQNIRRIEKPKYQNKAFEENQIISSAYSKISNEYKIQRVIDVGCSNPVKKIIYVAKQLVYYLLQHNANEIKIFDGSFSQIDCFSLPQTDKNNGFVLDFSFDKKNQIFGCIFENSARFCNMKVKTGIKFINQCQKDSLKGFQKLQFLPLHDLWCFMAKSGEMLLAKVQYKSRTKIIYEVVNQFKQHQSMITDITQIHDPLYIATSSMDGNIKLYSQALRKQQYLEPSSDQTYSIIDQKWRKGILGIDYAHEFGSFILGYNFSNAVFIYSLDISLTKGFLGKYSQHTGNIVTAKFLKSFPYALSLDDKLNLRIWDFRKFLTIQTINCEKHFINPSRLQLIPELSQCLICQKRITQFRAPALQKKSKEINQFHNIFDVKMCSMSNQIYLFSSNDVRIYNYLTGSLKRIFTKLSQQKFQTNISAAQFGHKSKKFFIGDAAGFIREYCSETGDFLQQIKPETNSAQYQNKQIVQIIFLKEHSLLICCSLDGRVLLFQRNEEGQFQIARDIRDSHQQICCANASSRYCLLATGGDDGTVNIWQLQKFNLQAVIVLQKRIVGISFSPIHPIMITCQKEGCISIFYVKPYQKKQSRYNCFAKLYYKQQITAFHSDLVINTYIPQNNILRKQSGKHHLLLAFGTKQGQIQIIDFNKVLKQCKIEENHQTFCLNRSIRCQILQMKSILRNQRNKILKNGYSNLFAATLDMNDLDCRIKLAGHQQQITQLTIVKQNSIILSNSLQKKLKVWNLKGQLIGAINFNTFKKSQWCIPEVNFHKKIQEIQTTIYSMKLLDNKILTKQEQQYFKVKLLLNQYMEKEQVQYYLQWISSLKSKHSLQSSINISSRKQLQAPSEALTSAQFDKIYQKLVSGITSQIKSISSAPLNNLIKVDNKLKKQQQKPSSENNDTQKVFKKMCKNNEQRKLREIKALAASKAKSKKYLYTSLKDAKKTIQMLQKMKNYRK